MSTSFARHGGTAAQSLWDRGYGSGMDPAGLDEPTLRRLIQVGRSLVSRLDVEGILESVLAAARELTGARYAALGILDERASL